MLIARAHISSRVLQCSVSLPHVPFKPISPREYHRRDKRTWLGQKTESPYEKREGAIRECSPSDTAYTPDQNESLEKVIAMPHTRAQWDCTLCHAIPRKFSEETIFYGYFLSCETSVISKSVGHYHSIYDPVTKRDPLRQNDLSPVIPGIIESMIYPKCFVGDTQQPCHYYIYGYILSDIS